ncbi:MAG TPA: hypothetical protein VNI54_00255 [Thermoanaerobaculia bacterium]|nr:hypothetical protein [Thermoanaerobaculia bacterium]
MTSLIDTLLPHCDFFERHSILVRASPERAYEAVRSTDLASSRGIRVVMAMRGITRASLPPFAVAAEDPPREVVMGIEGPFWKPHCRPYGVSDFRTPVPANVARGAWNFFVERVDDAHVRVTTETRVLCGENARRKFAIYWFLIRPGSGLIRRLMLRAIKREAER